MGEYKKLKNQPLKFVLAEFRFSPVMQISEYIPKIQEALRKQYPTPNNKREQVVQVQPSGITVSSLDRWAFVSADKKNAIDINQDRLIFITANYPRFEGFVHDCQVAIEVLADIVEPSLILRTGLRYGDLVTIDEGEQVSDVVNEHFALPKCIEALGAPQQFRNEVFLSTSAGSLSIRTLYGHHNLTCFPDIQGLPVEIDLNSSSSERIILDFDHFWESGGASVNFDTQVIVGQLNALHEASREAFWRVTSDYARNEKWA